MSPTSHHPHPTAALRVLNRAPLSPVKPPDTSGAGQASRAGLTAAHVTVLTPPPVTRHGQKRHTCKACRTPFVGAKQAKFCSHKCRQAHYRKRQQKARKAAPAPRRVASCTCVYCGARFVAAPGAKYCTPSHRTLAWAARRHAAIEAVAVLYGLRVENVADLADSKGMKPLRDALTKRGYAYDERARRWVVRRAA